MQVDKNVTEKKRTRVFFCWNSNSHPNFSEIRWEQEHNRNDVVNCPVCGMSHKVTMRMPNE